MNHYDKRRPEIPRAWPVMLVGMLIICGLGGCQTVEPWERGRLAHDCMQTPVDEVEAAYRGHLEIVREGSTGGTTSGGGGCGCN